MVAAVVFLNLAYVALLASTFTRTVSWLRVMLVTGAICFVVFGVVEGIVSMVLWNIAIGGMHLVQLVRDQLARKLVRLTDHEESIRAEFFADMSDFDFNLLWRLGVERTLYKSAVIERGEAPQSVMFVLNGTLDVTQEGETLRILRRGSLVGEMSFVSGAPASVDVVANGPVTLHEWEQQELHTLDQVNPAAAKAFRSYVSGDLAAKARL